MAAFGTICFSKNGSLQDIYIATFKKQGEHCIMTCSYKMLVMKILSRKYLTILFTA